ncbi:MAG: hypothetical protein HOP18_15505 [Deltaproteobacteria bacterium]|nr:hypothetical protein [Deltaproteobacteria bacterium]
MKTETPITERGRATYHTIASRLAALHPPIVLATHIAQRKKQDPKQGTTFFFSTLKAHDSTLDGINFVAANPATLVGELENTTDQWGARALASLKEDPDHWALKASFGKTIGTGWREIWRAAPYNPAATVLPESRTTNNLMRIRFGTAGIPIRFTALHCAVHEIGAQCNIHIDESGFVLALPKGVALTPDLYDHIMNELKLKTDFRNWLAGKMPNEKAARIVSEVIRRTALIFPNAANGYAGLEKTLNNIERPRGVLNGLWTAGRILRPIGVTFDVYDSDRFTVQVTGSILDGDRSITITLGGDW